MVAIITLQTAIEEYLLLIEDGASVVGNLAWGLSCRCYGLPLDWMEWIVVQCVNSSKIHSPHGVNGAFF